MNNKILAVLEIADHEVRLVVGQFYNSRLNILKIEQVPHEGIINFNLENKENIIQSIRKAITNASKNLGSLIEQVILIVPSVNMKTVSQEVNVSTTGRISEINIKNVYDEMKKYKGPDNTILVNTIITKYQVNGMNTRKVPIGESCETFKIYADLYYGNQTIVFDYVKLVEESGIKIMEIVLEDIAYAKEASLYEASISHPKILVHLHNHNTTLSIFYKGTLRANTELEVGIQQFIDLLVQEYKIPEKVARKIIYDNLSINDIDSLSDNPIFVWATKNQTNTITEKDLGLLMNDKLKDYVLEIVNICEPTLQYGETELVLTGVGAYIDNIEAFIEDNSAFDAKVYIPITYGCRDAILTTCLGALYYYKDQEKLIGELNSSINMEFYRNSILKRPSEDVPIIEESLTSKLKNIFK